MILKNETQGNYLIVSQKIMHDKTLKLFDRGLLITLMSLPDNWKFSARGLAAILCDGRDAITAGLQRLEARGYLVREQLREKGKYSVECLRINLSPNEPVAEKPLPEKPAPVKTSPGKPSTVNPAQYINKISNTKGSNTKIYPIRGGKETTDEHDRRKQDHNNASGTAGWSRDEIDLYGLCVPDL